ncbi:MAG: hypothetical protein ABIB47_01260 [Candidatus Woesearchaeota archaeon]
MRRLLTGLLLISLLVLAGCGAGGIDVSKLSPEDIDKVIKCEPPYIRHASGCCLDQNENKICDDDEGVDSPPTEPQEPIEPETPPEPEEPQGELPEPTSNLDLADYPQPFLDENNIFNPKTTIVVGESAPASDTIGAVDIMQQLQFDAKNLDGTPIDIDIESRTDAELSGSYENYDLIIVSTKCVNELMEKFGFDCSEEGWGLETGQGLIQLMENGNNVALIVTGTNAMDTRVATRVLKNYRDYDLNGNRVIVTGSLSDPVIS